MWFLYRIVALCPTNDATSHHHDAPPGIAIDCQISSIKSSFEVKCIFHDELKKKRFNRFGLEIGCHQNSIKSWPFCSEMYRVLWNGESSL